MDSNACLELRQLVAGDRSEQSTVALEVEVQDKKHIIDSLKRALHESQDRAHFLIPKSLTQTSQQGAGKGEGSSNGRALAVLAFRLNEPSRHQRYPHQGQGVGGEATTAKGPLRGALLFGPRDDMADQASLSGGAGWQ